MVVLEVLNKRRVTRESEWLLENVKPGEIQITRNALNSLLNRRYLEGSRPLEIFAGNSLSFSKLQVAVKQVSLHMGAAGWLQECCTVI